MKPLLPGEEIPIAYDVYPRDINEKKDIKHRVGISSALRFAAVQIPGIEYIKEVEFKGALPRIKTFGVGTSAPTWYFVDQAAFNLADINILYIIIQTQRSSAGVKLELKIYATVRTYLGRVAFVSSKSIGIQQRFEITF